MKREPRNLERDLAATEAHPVLRILQLPQRSLLRAARRNSISR